MKIAVSGSCSTGKTTTTIALSLLTGIEMIHARTMREILPAVFPGKRLEECNPGEIVELIFTRLQERIVEERKTILHLSPKMDIYETIVMSKQIVKDRFNSIKLEIQS
jgi:broad-specificity NMP kinase